jgi:hypothetical protein
VLLNYIYNENICMYKKVCSMLLSIQATVCDDVCHSYSLAFTSASLSDILESVNTDLKVVAHLVACY